MKNLHDIFVDELTDAYDAERQIIKALPTLIEKANDEQLMICLQDHLVETEEQVIRLEEVANSLGFDLKKMSCKGMAGILAEGEAMLEVDTTSEIKDALIIAAASKVEHYEIATYRMLKMMAHVLNYASAEDLISENLDEEQEAATTLESLAEGGILSQGLAEKAAESEKDFDDDLEDDELA